jgi:putative Holliday junction resolvase
VSSLLGLDIGGKRIGVALARADVRIAQPLTTLQVDDGDDNAVLRQIVQLIEAHHVDRVVAGWPRGLDGQATAQTGVIEAFVIRLRQALKVSAVAVSIVLQDEALTSQKAEAELTARRKPYAKGDIDALAATYILEDYLHEQPSEAQHV